MDPATLAVVSLASTAIGGVTSFIGSQQSATAASDAANYNAAVARNNQVIASQKAQYEVQAGRVAAQNQDFQNRAKLGAITAAQGAGGIDLDSTSSKEVRDSAAQLGRLDTSTVMNNALVRAYGSNAEATNFGAQAGLDTMQAKNAQTAGTFAGFSSLLGGASQFSDKWLRFQDQGIEGF